MQNPRETREQQDRDRNRRTGRQDRDHSHYGDDFRDYDKPSATVGHQGARLDRPARGEESGFADEAAYGAGRDGYQRAPDYIEGNPRRSTRRDDDGRGDYTDDRDRDRTARPSSRGFMDRATDEVASWFGDDDADRRRERDHRGRGPKNYRRPDARIEEDVNDMLTDDRHVDASEIEVAVKDGEVTLSGTVPSRSEKRRAEDCAESVSGVRHVQNNLRVASPADRSPVA